MEVRKMHKKNNFKKRIFQILAVLFLFIGVGTLKVDAYSTGWTVGITQRIGAYYESVSWRVVSSTSTSYNVEIQDTAWTSPSSPNYWAGHLNIYEVKNGNQIYLGRVTVPTDLHYFWGSESYSTTVRIEGYGNHHIRCIPDVFASYVTSPSMEFDLYIPQPEYYDRIDHWMWGLEKQEGNNATKDAYKMGSKNTIYDRPAGETFALTSASAMRIPNGYSLKNFSTSSISGSWQSYPIPTNVTQKAQEMVFEYNYYPNQYKIEYDVNGGNALKNPPTSYNVLYGPKLPTPTRKGYTFVGWKDTSTGGIVDSFNYNKNNSFSSPDQMYSELDRRPTGDKKVVAQWEPNKYDVVYKGNGGTWNDRTSWSEKATYDSNYTVHKNFFSKTGYEFVGWNTKADGTGTDWTSRINQPFKWTYDYGVTLYAQWKPITYTVVFNGNGHTTGIMKDQTLTYDKAEQLYKNTYKKDNADWIEWNTKPDGSGKSYKDQQQVKNLTSKKGEIITLYAIWDNVPVLETIDNAYKKGETITISKIIEDNATADDVEDGNLDDEIKVEKIKYPDGSVVNNPGENTKLNTDWENMQEIEVTFTVTDTYGHKVTNTSTITIINPFKPNIDPPVDVDGGKPKLYNRYIHKGYEWSLDGNSVWSQNEEYRNELNEVLNNLE